MEVPFTPEQEAKLAQIAAIHGTDPTALVKDAAMRLLDEDARFGAAVREGLAQADRGEFIEEDEMDARFEESSVPEHAYPLDEGRRSGHAEHQRHLKDNHPHYRQPTMRKLYERIRA